MKKYKEMINNIRMIYVIVPIILIVISFFTERRFFDFSQLQTSQYFIYIITKILLYIVLNFFSALIYYNIKKIDINNENCFNYLLPLLILLFVYGICVFITWPGNWNNDEFLILGSVRTFNIEYHQSFITSIFFIMCLMLIPYAGGIIVIQSILCAVIAAYIIGSLINRYGKLSYVLILLFISVPTIYFVLYPLRVCLYSFSLLLLMFKLYNLICDQNHFSKSNIIFTAILLAVVGSWRGESKFIFIFSFFLIILFCKKNISITEKILFYSISACLMLSFNTVNSLGDETAERTATIWSFMTGFSVMLEENNIKSYNLEEDLYNINKILPLDKLTNEPSSLDLGILQKNVGTLTFNDEEYNKFIKSAINLIIYNPLKYLKAKWDVFIASSGCSDKFIWVTPGANKEEIMSVLQAYNLSKDLYDYVKPRDENIQLKFIYYLTGMYTIKDTHIVLYKFLWNQMPPIIIVMVLSLILLIKREWKTLLWLMICGGTFFLVYLLQPTANVMYIFPFYINGYIIAFIIAMEKLKIQKRN